MTHDGGIPPTNTSEFELNFPNANSLPRDVLLCVMPSTVNDVCSSRRATWREKKGLITESTCFKLSSSLYPALLGETCEQMLRVL